MQGLSWAYAPDAATAASTAEAVYDALVAQGLAFVDTAWIYSTPGLPHSEETLGKAIAKHGRDKFIVSTKIGMDLTKSPPFVQDAAGLRGQLAESLARLGSTHVDLLILNRCARAVGRMPIGRGPEARALAARRAAARPCATHCASLPPP